MDSLEARVISRFPFRPSKAGTRMKISVMYWKASQCCGEPHHSLNVSDKHFTFQQKTFMVESTEMFL